MSTSGVRLMLARVGRFKLSRTFEVSRADRLRIISLARAAGEHLGRGTLHEAAVAVHSTVQPVVHEDSRGWPRRDRLLS